LVGSIPFLEQSTVVRIRGWLSVMSTAVNADVNITGAIGVGIVTEEAFAAGVVSIPEPFSDADWGGWMLWQTFAYSFEFGDATGVNFPPWQIPLDSKSMRKVSPNERLVIIAESLLGAYDVDMPLRVLVKLS